MTSVLFPGVFLTDPAPQLLVEGTLEVGAKLTLLADLGDPDGFDPAEPRAGP